MNTGEQDSGEDHLREVIDLLCGDPRDGDLRDPLRLDIPSAYVFFLESRDVKSLPTYFELFD
jgi:hypothetical protein